MHLDQHIFRLTQYETLRCETVFNLRGAYAERKRPKRAVGRGVRITTDDSHAGQTPTLLWSGYMDNAATDVADVEVSYAMLGAVLR